MENQNNGKSVASLVLGIISLVFIFFNIYAFVGMILAIIGLVIGIQAKKENPNDSKARAGVILCIIGLGLCALTLLACLACAGFVTSMFTPF